MESLPPAAEGVLCAVARRVTPGLARAGAEAAERFLGIVDRALAERPEAVRRQMAAFLGLIQRLPFLRYGRTFVALGPERQDAVLRWLQECPLSLLQKGFWGLRSLIFMGWYAQPELWSEWGYRPELDGNERLRD